MDRKIVVLTPGEWENKVRLGDYANKAYIHNHHIKTAQLALTTVAQLAMKALNEGNKEEVVSYLNQVVTISEKIYKNADLAQEGISDLATLIKYRLRKEAEEFEQSQD